MQCVQDGLVGVVSKGASVGMSSPKRRSSRQDYSGRVLQFTVTLQLRSLAQVIDH